MLLELLCEADEDAHGVWRCAAFRAALSALELAAPKEGNSDARNEDEEDAAELFPGTIRFRAMTAAETGTKGVELVAACSIRSHTRLDC